MSHNCLGIILDKRSEFDNKCNHELEQNRLGVHMKNANIGIIGAGIAGLSAAWMLRERYTVELLEQGDYLGGHTNTREVEEDATTVPVDTGFIVFNEPNYPCLTALLKYLDLPTRASEMSFAVSIGEGEIEYAGSSLGALYAQRRNLFSPAHQRMVWDILRFNRVCASDLAADRFGAQTVDDYLNRNRLSREFRDRYLLPMAAAIWSCPMRIMGSYPMASLARFFKNHGLIQLTDRPQWRTIVGGSHQYVRRMHADLGDRARLDSSVSRVERRVDGVVVTLSDGAQRCYDQVVLAAHADQSLRMIAEPSPREAAFLSHFAYQRNRAVLHTDTRLMPRNRKAWSSWNYMTERAGGVDDTQSVSVSYWMNRLQGLQTRREYLVTLNPLQEPDPQQVLGEFEYHHPVFSEQAVAMQARLDSLQGVNRIWFCGSYFGYGFHEDALASSVAVVRALPASSPSGDRAVSSAPLFQQPQGTW